MPVAIAIEGMMRNGSAAAHRPDLNTGERRGNAADNHRAADDIHEKENDDIGGIVAIIELSLFRNEPAASASETNKPLIDGVRLYNCTPNMAVPSLYRHIK